MPETQAEDEFDEDLQRYADLWGMTPKELDRFGTIFIGIFLGVAVIFAAGVLVYLWFAS